MPALAQEYQKRASCGVCETRAGFEFERDSCLRNGTAGRNFKDVNLCKRSDYTSL